MPIPRERYEEQIAAREAEDREARAAGRKGWLVTLAVCMAWVAVGLAMVVWALTTPMEREYALEVMRCAPGIAATGVLLTVLVSRVLAERRGDA